MKFVIMGEVTGKARPRVTKWGVYNTEKTVLYENLVKLSYQQQSRWYSENALEVVINAFYSIPKSVSKKNRELMLRGNLRPCKKPDIDNVVKIILDALNGIAYKDDTQVVDLYVRKKYSDQPRVEIVISEL